MTLFHFYIEKTQQKQINFPRNVRVTYRIFQDPNHTSQYFFTWFYTCTYIAAYVDAIDGYPKKYKIVRLILEKKNTFFGVQK